MVSEKYILFIKPEKNDGLKVHQKITEGEQLETGETIGEGNVVGRSRERGRGGAREWEWGNEGR
jgi:hypothetical protein